MRLRLVFTPELETGLRTLEALSRIGFQIREEDIDDLVARCIRVELHEPTDPGPRET